MDAMDFQKMIIHPIIEKGRDFGVPVKNQSKDVERRCGGVYFSCTDHLVSHSVCDKKRGIGEEINIWVTDKIDDLREQHRERMSLPSIICRL